MCFFFSIWQHEKQQKYTAKSRIKCSWGAKVSRGHNIVSDRWVEAANTHPHPTSHPTPFPTQTPAQKGSKNACFPLFDSGSHTDRHTDGRTDGPTNQHMDLWTNQWMDQRMDEAFYRVTCPQLKTTKKINIFFCSGGRSIVKTVRKFRNIFDWQMDRPTKTARCRVVSASKKKHGNSGLWWTDRQMDWPTNWRGRV